MIYLNEFDPFAADWLGMLSTLGHIPISYVAVFIRAFMEAMEQ